MMSKKKFFEYVTYYFLRILIIIAGIFPLEFRSKIGGFFLRKMMFGSRMVKTAYKNLTLIFPEKSHAEKNAILKKILTHFGRFLLEAPYIYSISEKKYNEKVKFSGEENLEYIKNGGIMFSAHYGNWEFVPRYLLNKKIPISVVYREANNALVDRLIQKYRNKKQINFIPKGVKGVKKLLKAVKNKHLIVMLVDQRMSEGILMDFLGHKAYVADGMARLAIDYNLPIMPTKTWRNNENKIEVTFLPPLKFDLSEGINNVQIIVELVNRIIEDWIKEDPTQWLWFHRKWESNRVKK